MNREDTISGYRIKPGDLIIEVREKDGRKDYIVILNHRTKYIVIHIVNFHGDSFEIYKIISGGEKKRDSINTSHGETFSKIEVIEEDNRIIIS